MLVDVKDPVVSFTKSRQCVVYLGGFYFLCTLARLVLELTHTMYNEGHMRLGWRWKHKTVRNRDIRRSVEGRVMGYTG